MKFEYYGKFLCRMDEKGRIILPPKFRKKLGKRIVIIPSSDGCLRVRPGRNNKNDILVDKKGRIIISQLLRKYSKLEKEVVIIGWQTRVEIWSKEMWEKEEKETREIQRKVFS